MATTDGAGDADSAVDRTIDADAAADGAIDKDANPDIADAVATDTLADGAADGLSDGSVDGDAFQAADGTDVVTTAARCVVPADIYAPIDTLSRTGCVDPAAPANPIQGAVTYEVNSPLWSDGADKTRAFLLPAGGKIHVKNCTAAPADCPNGAADDGKWVFPVGTVMVKTFAFDGKLVETRLLMHADDGTWIGYSYQWNEAQTDAMVAPIDRATVAFNTGLRTVTWHYPSRKDCQDCHNGAGGGTLGPETAQMNRVVGNANQIDRLTALNVFDTPPAQPYKSALVTPYAGSLGAPPPSATTEQKARSYLHANCSFCHRPGGTFPNFDLRNDVSLAATQTCNVSPTKGAAGGDAATTRLLVPGQAARSVIWLRMNQVDPDLGRMPQIGSYVVDTDAVKLVGDWIASLPGCP